MINHNGGIVITEKQVLAVAVVLSALILGSVLVGVPILGKASDKTTLNTTDTASSDDLSDNVIRCYGIKENYNTITALQNTVFLIVLNENPTTGFHWNVSLSDGLNVTADCYLPSYPDRPGAGGVHVWSVKATGEGEQSFKAEYGRPWDNTTAGNYQLNVHVDSVSYETG